MRLEARLRVAGDVRFPDLHQGAWQAGQDVRGNDERNAVADAAFGDLVAQPHQ